MFAIQCRSGESKGQYYYPYPWWSPSQPVSWTRDESKTRKFVSTVSAQELAERVGLDKSEYEVVKL